MLGNFKIIDVNERMANGTSLVGYITEDYSTLVEVFGPPHFDQPSGDGKVHTEWNLEFTVQEDGEEDMLDMAFEPKQNSRLSCQLIVSDELDGLVVNIPSKQG